MVLYNPSLSHEENQYSVDNDTQSTLQATVRAMQDVFTVWLTESSMKLWVRGWLVVLCLGAMSPFAFLPHPFAIANGVGLVVITALNGRELVRVRGVNKNMGWQHVLGWTPVMVVNILCLTTDLIGGDQLSWNRAGDDAYNQARYVVVIFNTAALGISMVFDVVDTIMYHGYGHKTIERSRWTTDQLTPSQKGGASLQPTGRK